MLKVVLPGLRLTATNRTAARMVYMVTTSLFRGDNIYRIATMKTDTLPLFALPGRFSLTPIRFGEVVVEENQVRRVALYYHLDNKLVLATDPGTSIPAPVNCPLYDLIKIHVMPHAAIRMSPAVTIATAMTRFLIRLISRLLRLGGEPIEPANLTILFVWPLTIIRRTRLSGRIYWWARGWAISKYHINS